MTQTSTDFETLTETFRAVMGSVAAPVSVVTTLDRDGAHGATVSAFSSLSMAPAMMLISLDKTSRLLTRLRAGSPIGVNVLADNQDDVAIRFATKGGRKFDGVTWRSRHGAPALTGVHAWVAMTAAQFHTAGDHIVVFGEVVEAEVQPNRPLTYWRRTFGTHLPTA